MIFNLVLVYCSTQMQDENIVLDMKPRFHGFLHRFFPLRVIVPILSGAHLNILVLTVRILKTKESNKSDLEM